ncbi:CidB/LrgB family autolysis modulator [Marinicrinis lubricantis]|uniref:CidB/LrgB family autolysis modulator n=1 Tax=Marinicrinis lubricantis TaxID=2086470 RepID=A0ABW1IVN8_9BACL
MIAGFISLTATLVVYILAKRAYSAKKMFWLSPLLVTPAALVVLLIFTHTSYETYNSGGKWLSYMLSPATVAFAIPLYKHYPLIKKHASQILISVLAGAAVAAVSSALMAFVLHLNPQIVYSLVPRSVTTPIAMDVSEWIGGIPTITAVFVILTGILGSAIGPAIIRLFRIKDDVARGVLLGTSAHGAGTSKAFEFSSLAGTVSSVSMIIAALVTLFLTPSVFMMIDPFL